MRTYKRLAEVERVFRTMKTTEFLVRPIFHRAPGRVRAHIFLCMLAAHVSVELERRLARFLYVDPVLATTRDTPDPVKAPPVSPEGRRKKSEHVTQDGDVLHSLKTLLRSRGSLSRVTLRMAGGAATFDRDSIPSDWQRAVRDAGRSTPA